MIDKKEKNIVHIFTGLTIINFLFMVLTFILFKKTKKPEAKEMAYEAIWFQGITSVPLFVFYILHFKLDMQWALIPYVILVIFILFVMFNGLIKTTNDEDFNYPFADYFIKK